MAYNPLVTPGGNPYLGGDGVFPQFVRGLQWMAEKRDDLDRAVNAELSRATSGIPAPSGESLDDLKPGIWQVTNIAQARALGLPSGRPGTLTVTAVGGAGAKTAFFQSIEAEGIPARCFATSRIGSSWSAWKEFNAGAGGGESQAATVASRSILRDGVTARKGGRIGTDGRGVIALRFDDAPDDFREKVLPLLVERGLPYTRVTTSERIHTQMLQDSEWPLMQEECIHYGGEVWNHGRTHGDMTPDTMHSEIIGARDTLRKNLPRLPIDCFSPPGGNVTYVGHMPSKSAVEWDTPAGQLIWSAHGLVTGYIQESYYWQLDGQGRDGQIHYSLDAYTLTRARQLVDRARDWGVGVVLMWHANNIGSSGQMSVSDFAAVLDYVVEQRDAGRILSLTVSGMAFADKGSSYRDDILNNHSAQRRFSDQITFPQYRRNVPGSTRELVATVKADAGTRVLSRVGESAKVSVVPASGTLSLRHVATIPTDVTSLPVEIDAPASDVHLWAI